jgi:hypothetical protein
MLMESGTGYGAQQALRAIPQTARALPTQQYLGVRASWVNHRYDLAELCLLGALARHQLPSLFLEAGGEAVDFAIAALEVSSPADLNRERDDWFALVVMVMR